MGAFIYSKVCVIFTQNFLQCIINVKESKFYSITADETLDSSHKEKMSLILCFDDAKIDIREEFIAFLHCKWGLSED